MSRLFFRRLLQTGFVITAVCTPVSAYASVGAPGIVNIITTIFDNFYATAMMVAVLMLVIAAIRIIASTDEGGLAKVKSSITAVVVGLMFIALAGPIVRIMYQTNGINPAIADSINWELVGISEWLSSMAAMVGIAIIVLGAFRAIASFGDEAAYKNVRTALAHVIVGMILISVGYAIKLAFFNQDANPLITLILGRVAILLSLMTLVAICIVIYAGIRLVANFGNDEVLTSSRSLIFRAVGGLVVIGVSFIVTELVVRTL